MRSVALVPLLVVLVGCGSAARPEPTDQKELTAGALPDSAAKQESFVAAKDAKGAPVPAGEVQAGWITTFKDAQLEELVKEAMANSRDIAQVAARLEQAQARARQAGADLGPTIGYAAGAAGSGATAANDLNKGVGAGLTFTWEADIWGRISSQNAAIAAQAQASALDLQWARESLGANVAKALFLARLAAVQEGINRDILGEQDKLVKIQEARKQIGKASDAEVAAAKAELNDALQRLTQASASREEAVRSLELLLGRYPKGELVTGDKLPEPPGPPPVGLPSQLLERRPDMIAATRKVAAAFNQVESAKAARLPRLSFTAGGGLASGDFQSMNVNGLFWNAIGNFVGPLYDGGRLKEQVVIEEAKQKEALAAYGQAGLQAFRQVESGLGNGVRLEQRTGFAKETLANRQQALTAIEGRKQVGQVGEDAVVPARLQVLQAKSLVQSLTADQLTARVDLFLALGGGFEAPAPTKDDLAQPPKVEVR